MCMCNEPVVIPKPDNLFYKPMYRLSLEPVLLHLTPGGFK